MGEANIHADWMINMTELGSFWENRNWDILAKKKKKENEKRISNMENFRFYIVMEKWKTNIEYGKLQIVNGNGEMKNEYRIWKTSDSKS